MDPMKTGALIAKLRKEKNLTQEALAEKIGVTRKAVSRWETGRGYPDIEILPRLAEVLSVSINEILSGEQLPPDPVSDKNLTHVCREAARTRTAQRRWIIVLAACFAVAVFLVMRFAAEASGSENCIIAEDYSAITYCGETYVPLDIGDYQCRIGHQLVSEASVENLPLIVKLFFGDSVYEVAGAADGSLLYLQTDFDLPQSAYYVRESQLAQMEQILSDFTDGQVYGVITQKDWKEREVPLEGGLPTISTSAAERDYKYDRSRGDVEIPVVIYETNHIFYRVPGAILYKDGEYYWYDDQCDLYPIAQTCDAELDGLLSYMYQ